MPHAYAELKYRTARIKVMAVVLVAGLHLVVLGAVLGLPGIPPEIDNPAAEARFVEISAEIIDAASRPAPAEKTDEPVRAPELVPKTKPLPAPAPEPEVISEPEVIPEPTPPPEAVPNPKHKPEQKAAPRQKPAPTAVRKVPPTTDASDRTSTTAVAVAPAPATSPSAKLNAPRLIGKVDYLGQRPRPEYPRISMRRGESGRVVVRVVISPQGSVSSASVRTSSGYPRLDEAALKAAQRARFKPYTENGVAYSAMADIPFDFVL